MGFPGYHEMMPIDAGRRIICAAILAACAGCCSLYCASHVPAGDSDACVTPKDMLPEQGWIDENSYQLSCCGFPPKEEVPLEQREDQARKGALVECQWQIMNVFTEKYDKKYKELYSQYMSVDSSGIPAWRKELVRILKSGTIVGEKCSDAGNCSITYRVSKNGLKRWVEELPNTLWVPEK